MLVDLRLPWEAWRTAEAGQHHLVINRQIIQNVEFLLGKPLGDDPDAERDKRDNQDRKAWKESAKLPLMIETGGCQKYTNSSNGFRDSHAGSNPDDLTGGV